MQKKYKGKIGKNMQYWINKYELQKFFSVYMNKRPKRILTHGSAFDDPDTSTTELR